MLIAFCLSRRNCSADVIPVFMTTAPTWAGEFPATLAFKRAWANGAKAKPSVTGMELRERPKLFTSRRVIDFLVLFPICERRSCLRYCFIHGRFSQSGSDPSREPNEWAARLTL